MFKVKNFLDNYDNSGTIKSLKAALIKLFQSIYEDATSENFGMAKNRVYSIVELEKPKDMGTFKSIGDNEHLEIIIIC